MDPELTSAEYLRVWRTLLLARVQELYKKEKKVLASDRVRLGDNIPVPAPLPFRLTI